MSEIWSTPGTHGVRFNVDAPSRYDAIAEFLTAGTDTSDPLVLVARPETCAGVAALLASGRFGPPVSPERVRFVDAAEALSAFTDGDVVDIARAEAMFLALIAEVRAREPRGTIRLYGEIVDLLCERGDFAGALALEAICANLFVAEPRLAVLCCYARARFDGADAGHFSAVCELHTQAQADGGSSGAEDEAPPPQTVMRVPTGPCVYVIDDDDSVRRSLGRFLRLAGYDVRTYDSGETFFLELEELAAGCLVVDMQLAGMSGSDILAHMQAARPSWPKLAMSGSDDDNVESEALRLGARAFLHKPLDTGVLLAAIAAAMT